LEQASYSSRNAKGHTHEKKTLVSTLVLALLITVVAGTLIGDSAKANPYVPEEDISEPEITFNSPIEGEYFNSTTIPIQIHVVMHYYYPYYFGYYNHTLLSVKYLIDTRLVGEIADDNLPKHLALNLTDLRDGKHSLEVIATGNYVYTKTGSSGKIYFTVDTTAPEIEFVPSQQKTFDSASGASFNFACIEIKDETLFWLGYSLDGKDVIAVTDNVSSTIIESGHFYQKTNYQLTLNGLSDGSHSLTVYAKDSAGNVGESETFQFTVGQEAQPEPDQTESEGGYLSTLVVASLGIVAVISIGAGLLFFFRKQN
jgi:hypothetical protein